jgi:hypothetical protein
MKKSIGDNMIPKEWGLDRGLALVKQAGYDGVDLWLGDRPWFGMDTTDAAVRGLRGADASQRNRDAAIPRLPTRAGTPHRRRGGEAVAGCRAGGRA